MSAVAALAIQVVIVGSALRQRRSAGSDDSRARSRIIIGQRVAALLLAIAAVTMAAARYA